MVDRTQKKRPKGNYEVGYAKPPEKTKFTKGGPNPSRGRNMGAVNSSPLRKVLETKIPLMQDGKRRRLPLGEAIAFLSANDAIKGNAADRRLMLQILLQLDRLAPRGPESPSPEEEAKKRELSQPVAGGMVEILQLHATLRHLGLIHRDDQGRLTIPASVAKEAEKYRPGTYDKHRPKWAQPSEDAAEPSAAAEEERGAVRNPKADITPEQRQQLWDEVTPEAMKPFFRSPDELRTLPRKAKPKVGPSGGAGNLDRAEDRAEDPAEQPLPDDEEARIPPGDATGREEAQAPPGSAAPGGGADTTPEEPTHRPTLSDYLMPWRKD